MAARRLRGLARLRRECGIAVSAGENAISVIDFRAMFDAGAVDYAQPSVTKIGGVTEMMRIAALARDKGVALYHIHRISAPVCWQACMWQRRWTRRQ
jgi:L-alanine-DL-glutamate epimerase-like enolase superfamily enzyme